jgi:hypothetical protein
MNFFAHLATSFSLLLSSIFGVHTSPPTVATTSTVTTSTRSASIPATSTSEITPANTAPKQKTSIFGSALAALESAPAAITKSVTTSVAATTSKPVAIIAPTPAPAPTPSAAPNPATTTPATTVSESATVDSGQNQIRVGDIDFSTALQTTDTAIASIFDVTGKASNTSSVTAVIANLDSDSTDWSSISSADDSYIVPATVTNGKWDASFTGVTGGSYKMFVYDTATHTLLATQDETISAPPSITLDEVTLRPTSIGIGQEVTDGELTIKLISVSSSGVATVYILDQPKIAKNYTMNVGDSFPSATTGFDDEFSPTLGLNIKVISISASGKTITFKVTPAPRVPGANGVTDFL